MIEMLRKAGVTDLGAIGHTETAKPNQIEGGTTEPLRANEQMRQLPTPKNMGTTPENPQASQSTPVGVNQKPSPQKSVTFIEDERENRERFPSTNKLKNTPIKSTVLRQGPGSGRITEITEDGEEHQSPVIPVDEPPEDSALRREMLQYTFSEVGAVVAELELEENSQYSHSDEYDEDDENQETSSVEEEEDKFGRTTRRVVDDKYRKEMEMLERKLRVRMMENIGPRPNESTLGNSVEGSRGSSVVINKSASSPSDELKKPAKKGVRFAEELDISSAPQKDTTDAIPEASELQPPLEESVFERGFTAGVPIGPGPPKARKGSKIKSSRAPNVPTAKQPPAFSPLQWSADNEGTLANGPLKEGVAERRIPGMDPSLHLAPAAAKKNVHQFSSPIILHEETKAVPESPRGKILSNNIVERPTVARSAEPPDPDGLDPALLRQEVVMEYHHIRNRMIQREGGFMPREEELERVPLTEEEGGSGKKVSRFKAARLGKRVGP